MEKKILLPHSHCTVKHLQLKDIEFMKSLVMARGKPFSNYSKGVSDLKACLDYSNHYQPSELRSQWCNKSKLF
jgi:hypothetical protein